MIDAAIRIGRAALAGLGNQGAAAVAVMVIVAIGVPQLGAILKPYVAEAVFALLVMSFIRMHVPAIRQHLHRPGLVIAAITWTMIGIPFAFAGGFLLVGVDPSSDVALALALQAVAPPMMAAPALATLMRLDATPVLMALIGCMAITAVTTPLFAYLLVGDALTFTPMAMALQLAMILAGSLTVALVVRRAAGIGRIERYRPELDGLNLIVIFVFIAAVMENVAENMVSRPWLTAGIAVLATTAFLIMMVLSAGLFRFFGRQAALSIGMMTAQRNMGLMVAATAGDLPDLVWLYIALSQLPIYLTPQILKGLVAR